MNNEGWRQEAAAGGSRELADHGTDPTPVNGEKEGGRLGRKGFSLPCSSERPVADIVPEQRFPINEVLC